MSLPVIDRAASLKTADATTRQLLDLIRTAPDPQAKAIGHWSIADLTCHMSHVYPTIARMLRGEGSSIADHRQIGAAWDAEVAKDPERNSSITRLRLVSMQRSSCACAAASGCTSRWPVTH